MATRRYQRGSVKPRKHGAHQVWVAQWRDLKGKPRSKVLGRCSELTESQAVSALATILAPINAGRQATATWNLGDYVERVFLPLQARVWKESTAATSEQRIRQHILPAFRRAAIADVSRAALQDYLDAKCPNYTASTIKHLRWDLNQIFCLAMADKIIAHNPAAELRVAPRLCKEGRTIRPLTEEQVSELLIALGPRERLLCRLGIFEGLRIGEILALQWQDVEGRALQVRRRVYYGQINTPKGKPRECAISAGTVALMAQWRRAAEWNEAEDFLFPSENRRSPMRPENIWKHAVRPLLKPLGLDWVTPHLLRHTNGTLMKKAGADAKVGADQRGHGIGVSLSVYTQSALGQKKGALDKLERVIDRATKAGKKKRSA